MSRRYLLDPGLPYRKANLHGHTIISDGKHTPESYVEAYQRRGYDIVALTDHERYRYHKHLTTADFVCLAAYEEEIYPEPVGDELIDREKKCYHLNVFDLRPWDRPEGYEPPKAPQVYYDKEAINSWIAQMRQDGLLVCYNHPAWSMQDYRDYACLKGLWAMEVYNHGCEVEGMYGMAPQVYDEMLRSGQRLCCVGTDDNHNHFPADSSNSDSYGGFTVFNLRDLTYQGVARAMEEGRFYASMGPHFQELSLEGRTLRIRCSPVQKICVFTESRRVHIKIAEPATLIDFAEFELDDTSVYIRVQLQDNGGRYGFSRAYFGDELFGG